MLTLGLMMSAVPLLVWLASKFMYHRNYFSNHTSNSSNDEKTNSTSTDQRNNNLLSSSSTARGSSSWQDQSFVKKLANIFSLFEKAISDDDLSKRISSSSGNTLTSMESGQDHGKILHFKKCSLNIVMDTLQSNSMKQLIMDFNAKQQQQSVDEGVVTTGDESISNAVTSKNDLQEGQSSRPIPPFEGLELSHLFNLDLYSSIDDSIRLELVSMMLREDLSLVKGYLSKHIHMIEITHCKLTRIPIELLSQFPNLTTLNLSHNLIDSIPEEFFVLASEKCPLKVLNLSENKLRSIPNYFSTLFIKHKLLTLNVQENYIDLNTAIPTELKYITGRDKAHLTPNDDFTSPVNIPIKKNSPKARLSFSKVLTRKGSSHSHHHETMRFICHMQRVPQLISDRLYLGSSAAATNLQELKKLGIDSIVCVNTITPFPDDIERSKLFKNYLQISETDEEKTNIIQYFDTVIDWIDQCLNSDPNSHVLVHCSAGMSRSATLIIAYVMKKLDKNAEEAYQYVRERRCCISPNTGFLTQIQLYQDIGKSFNGPMFENYVLTQIFKNDKDHPSFVSLNYLKMIEFPPKFLLEKYELYREIASVPSLNDTNGGEEVHNEQQKQPMGVMECMKQLAQQFSKLIMLELQWNCIQNLEPLVVKFNLHEMVELDLSHNCIEQIPMELFTNMPQLRILNLSYNKIKSLPKIIRNFPTTSISLDHEMVSTTTELTNVHKEAQENNDRIQSVLPIASSSTSSSTTIIETNLEGIVSTKLVDLRLGHNLLEQICENEHESLFHVILKNLEMLDLSHNKLKSIPSYERCFSHLQSLRVLSLYHNCFETEPTVIGELRKLGKIVYYSSQTQNLREILKI